MSSDKFNVVNIEGQLVQRELSEEEREFLESYGPLAFSLRGESEEMIACARNKYPEQLADISDELLAKQSTIVSD